MNPVKQAIADIVTSLSSATSFQPISLSVKAVDVSKRTLNASDVNGSVFHSIRLQYLGASILLVPAVGSTVLVFYDFDSHCGFVAGCSKIESAEIVIGDTSAVMDADGLRIKTEKMSADINRENIIFNGGNLNGLVVIQKLTNKLNELKDTVNDLITKYNTHVHVCAAPGSPCKPIDAPAQPAKAFNKSDYENTKIKQ